MMPRPVADFVLSPTDKATFQGGAQGHDTQSPGPACPHLVVAGGSRLAHRDQRAARHIGRQRVSVAHTQPGVGLGWTG